jgi:hypothetical protein
MRLSISPDFPSFFALVAKELTKQQPWKKQHDVREKDQEGQLQNDG